MSKENNTPKETETKEEIIIPIEEQLEILKKEHETLKKLNEEYKKNAPKMLIVERPIQLNHYVDGYLFQLSIPPQALSHIKHFGGIYEVLGVYKKMLENMEKEARESLEKQKIEKEAEKKEESTTE